MAKRRKQIKKTNAKIVLLDTGTKIDSALGATAVQIEKPIRSRVIMKMDDSGENAD